MGKRAVSIGEKFNRFTIKTEADARISKSGRKTRVFNVECICGVILIKSLPCLVKGKAKDCGCLDKKNDSIKVEGTKTYRWTILELFHQEKSIRKSKYVKAQCECGTIKMVKYINIITGKSQSCGCYALEVKKKNNTTHGDGSSRLYGIYNGIKKRCNNEKSEAYKNYGGRGIRCEWLTYEDFKTDMFESYVEGLTIERNEVDGNYCKSNCRWIPKSEQSRNRRGNVYYNGLCMAEYCRKNGLKAEVIRGRILRGVSIEEAIRIGNDKMSYHPNYILSSKKIQ